MILKYNYILLNKNETKKNRIVQIFGIEGHVPNNSKELG